MKRSLLIGSFLCVCFGLIAIIFALIGVADIIAIFVLLTAYFIGVPMQFAKTLPTDVARQLAEGQIIAVFGKRFWFLIIFGVAGSVAAAIMIRRFYNLSTSETLLFGLGVAAILTAFVSPKFETVELLNTDTFE